MNFTSQTIFMHDLINLTETIPSHRICEQFSKNDSKKIVLVGNEIPSSKFQVQIPRKIGI